MDATTCTTEATSAEPDLDSRHARFERAADERRKELAQRVKDGDLPWSWDGRTSVGATKAQMLAVRFSLFGWLYFLTIVGTITLAVMIGPSREEGILTLKGLLAGTTALAGIICVECLIWAHGRWLVDIKILRDCDSRTPSGLLGLFDEAVMHLKAAATAGIANAETALVQARAMESGLEELAVELARFERIHARGKYDYAQRDYVTEVQAVTRELTTALVAAVADVETAARFIFNDRTDLAVPVPTADPASRPVLPVLNLSKDAQQALADAREALRRLA